jgi:four helix bundle protein
MKITSFEELNIWKKSIEITKQIYKFTQTRPFIFDHALTDQIRRASISISSNIVEGFERNNNNEFIYFLRISKGSLGEVRNQVIIAREIGYISEKNFTVLNEKLKYLSNQIGTFISYLQTKRKQHAQLIKLTKPAKQ